jgi:hypothetical protein
VYRTDGRHAMAARGARDRRVTGAAQEGRVVLVRQGAAFCRARPTITLP